MTCWAVLGVSGLVTLWALFWDRSRGRLRCRKCAYDMSGGGLTCPECGREHKSERSLRVTRRKWKTGTVSILALLICCYVQLNFGRMRREGPAGLLPSIVLVSVCDPESYMCRDYAKSDPLIEAVDSRLSTADLPRFAMRTLARRVASVMRTKIARSDLQVATYDLSKIAPQFAEFQCRASPVFDSLCFGSFSNQDAMSYASIFLGTSEESSGLEYYSRYVPNNDPAACFVGEILIVTACRSEHEAIKSGIEQVRYNNWIPGRGVPNPIASSNRYFVRYDTKPLLTGSYREKYEQFEDIDNGIESDIHPDCWHYFGVTTALASKTWIGERIIVVYATKEIHEAIENYLDALTPP